VYSITRDVSEQHISQAALRELLLSTSFDLRINALNVQAASTLLLVNEAVRSDPEAAFLASAVQSSCNLLLGIVSNVIEVCCAMRLSRVAVRRPCVDLLLTRHRARMLRCARRCASWREASLR
jgi:hypothetical protein